MAHVTRIKAKDSAPAPTNTPKKPQQESAQKPQKASKTKHSKGKKPFILFRPFVAFGRYLRDSWRELRQVRWPNRKVTWKMVLAVFVYTAVVIAFLVALDILFDWLFSLILK